MKNRMALLTGAAAPAIVLLACLAIFAIRSSCWACWQ